MLNPPHLYNGHRMISHTGFNFHTFQCKVLCIESSMRACMLSHFSHVWLSGTLWTAARQAPLSTGFSRQGHWSGSPRWPWSLRDWVTGSPVAGSGSYSPAAVCRLLTVLASLVARHGPGGMRASGVVVHRLRSNPRLLYLLYWRWVLYSSTTREARVKHRHT